MQIVIKGVVIIAGWIRGSSATWTQKHDSNHKGHSMEQLCANAIFRYCEVQLEVKDILFLKQKQVEIGEAKVYRSGPCRLGS